MCLHLFFSIVNSDTFLAVNQALVGLELPFAGRVLLKAPAIHGDVGDGRDVDGDAQVRAK